MKILCLLLMMTASFFPSFKTPVVHTVKIEGMRFVPKTIKIKPGDKVRWINSTGSSHNVVANDKSFASEMMEGNGEVFEYTFTQAGKFGYYCRPHKPMGMKGVVIVEEN